MGELSGAVAVVTGASRGLGKGCGVLVVGDLFALPPNSEALVGENVGSGLLVESGAAPEVIEVRVSDDCGVDIGHLVAGPTEAVDEFFPRCFAG